MGKHQLLIGLICVTFGWSGTVYDHFLDFCRLGERSPGTPGHARARDYIIRHARDPEVDSFFVRGTWFYNIYKRYPGEAPRIGLGVHWDSDVGCPGANDGGSGVALMLALIDTLEQDPPPTALDVLFFDGEDVDKADLLGSEHFASRCVTQYSFVVIFDMVGDRDLHLSPEGNSRKFFPDLVDSLWQIGVAVAPGVFMPSVKYYIIDDHMSLIKYGFRAVDIIDFDYPYWDTAEDTVDKCSRESLETMFRYVVALVYGAAGRAW